jgi:recombination protein RecT
MVRIAQTAFRQNPLIQKCEPYSVMRSVLLAAQSGWEIGTQAYLVPFRNKKTGKFDCQLIPDWKGLSDLVARTGKAMGWTGAVHQGDEFAYALGDRPFITHRPTGVDETDEKLQYVYAVGRIKGGDWPILEVWSVQKIQAHRDRFNRVGQEHYSYVHFEMYARKVPFLQILKYLPKSVELTDALQLEYDAQAGEPQRNPLINLELLPDTPETTEPPPPSAHDAEMERRNIGTEALKKTISATEQAERWPKKEKPNAETPETPNA